MIASSTASTTTQQLAPLPHVFGNIKPIATNGRLAWITLQRTFGIRSAPLIMVQSWTVLDVLSSTVCGELKATCPNKASEASQFSNATDRPPYILLGEVCDVLPSSIHLMAFNNAPTCISSYGDS